MEGMSKRAMVLAPHPDDESIIGLLALRLREECGFEVVVVPATLGSRAERREARRGELRAACAALGFRLRFPRSLAGGMAEVGEIRSMLEAERPAIVLMPHAKDGHPTHRAAHWLGVEAMDGLAGEGWCVAETEYWHPLERPNLMVAADGTQVETLCRALGCHEGEVARNDYAARLPAWMVDNVRRGAELVGGRGAEAPAFAFATLYRVRKRAGGRWRECCRGGRIAESSADLGELAEIFRE